MISQTATTVLKQPALAPTVFSILDSRIQFLEYQINIQFDPQKQQSENHLLAYDQLMNFYNNTCKALKLLQILKEWVSEKNAPKILSLIQDDAYLSYSENQLEKIIQVREFEYS